MRPPPKPSPVQPQTDQNITQWENALRTPKPNSSSPVISTHSPPSSPSLLSGNTERLHLQLSPTQDIDFESSSHNLDTQDLKIRLDFTESESVADRNAIHMNSEPSSTLNGNSESTSTLNLQMPISQNSERGYFGSDSHKNPPSKRKNRNFTPSYQADTATTQDLDLYLGLSDDDELPNLPDFMTTSTPAPGKVPARQTSQNTFEDDDIECLTPLRSSRQKQSATFSVENDVVVVQETEKYRDSTASEVILGNDSHFSGTSTGKNRKRKSDVFVDMTDQSENTQGDGPAPKKKKRKSKDGKTEKCPSCQSELFCSVVH